MRHTIPITVPIIAPAEPIDYVPHLDFVLVEPQPKTHTAGGIALPEKSREEMVNLAEPFPAKILAVGPGRVTEYGATLPTDHLKVGSLVYVFPFTPCVPFRAGSKIYPICRARDVIGDKVTPTEAKAA